jgi:sec-independent protein translocase protein TatA
VIGDIFQPTHLIFIFVVALLVLGPKRLPEVGRSLGKGIRDFRGAMSGIEDQARDVFDHHETDNHETPASTELTTAAELAPPAPAEEEPTVSLASASASATRDNLTVPIAASVNAHAATRAVPVSTAGVIGSGSGSAEPHPDDYAD